MARLGACATPSTIKEEYFRVLSFAIETYRGNMPLPLLAQKNAYITATSGIFRNSCNA
jgi:hypothetical protein